MRIRAAVTLIPMRRHVRLPQFPFDPRAAQIAGQL